MQAYLSEIKNSEATSDGVLRLSFCGCNFLCPFCNTPNMLVTKEEFLFDLKDLKKQILNSGEDAILFTGGEPCMQRQALYHLGKFAKDIGKKIILQTNGSKPDTIKYLVNEKLVDMVILEIKAPLEEDIFEKVTKSRTFFKPTNSIIEDIKQTIELLRENSVKTKVATTIVPGLMFKKEEVLKIAKIAEHLNAQFIMQQFDNTLCHDTRYMSIKPASFEFLQNLKDFVKKEYPLLFVEIRTNY